MVSYSTFPVTPYTYLNYYPPSALRLIYPDEDQVLELLQAPKGMLL
jgi:hypothetical protein